MSTSDTYEEEDNAALATVKQSWSSLELMRDSRSLQVSRSHTWLRSPIWPFCALILFVTVLLQYRSALTIRQSTLGSWENGYSTEYHGSADAIDIIQKRFSSAIRDDQDGNLFGAWAEGETRYTTSSNATFEEVDAAWDELLHGRYAILKPSEIGWLNEDSVSPALTPVAVALPGGIEPGIYGGPDMLHSLHCLNSLRKNLDIDRYEGKMHLRKEYRRLHIDHCIDQLRQAILCHGDMTPVTLKPVAHDGKVWVLLGETERTHTCRDGMKLRDWWWERGAETGRLKLPGR